MWRLNFFTLWLLLALASTQKSLLTRPLHVYENLIQGVHDYFNNTCIILFHGSPNVIETEGLEDIDGLLTLQKYFSGSLSIRTAIMDFHMFKDRVGNTYYNIKRPLFVLLNDLDEIKEQFVVVSKWIAMAYPTWLIFLRNDTSFEDFLEEVYVPFNCVLMVTRTDTEGHGEIVKDVYRISREDDLKWMEFGVWDPEQGFRGPRKGLYQRRHDLHGLNLRVISIHDPPVSLFVKNEVNRTIGMRGFFGEVILLLQQGMNCTFSYQEINSWGIRLPNGTWSGSIGMLMDDKADLAATELMMTLDRLDVVEFTTPVYSTKCRVYIKRPDTMAIKWDAYLAPFTFSVWNAIALTIIITSLTIATIDAVFSKEINSRLTAYRSSLSTFFEILFFVFGAFCGQGMELSSLDPIRLVHLSIHSTAVVVLAAYSAALISYLAIKTFVMPFTTMEGMLEDGSYRFAVVANSADYSFFQLKSGWTSVELEDAMPLLLFLLFAFIITWLVLFIERSIYEKRGGNIITRQTVPNNNK
ncbi:glutamate receptor ionotropic, delta-1 isoform X4 [Ptiloglossa arizonensis]|uniref:glutamate receptor ionotropic, delta-1 isoform X4 n=1 Tax=Ptiloglossa arizonensis TaxID=3350558 RepID=UPI003F9FD57E